MNDFEKKLKAPPAPEAPFLHARIMNAVRSADAESKKKNWNPAWAFAVTAVILAATITFSTRPKNSAAVVNVTIPTIELPQLPAKPLPIETELENLKADTRNAARALAASFLPGQD